MKAAISTSTGVQIAEVPKPVPAANEVLVRVRASGMNRIDLFALQEPKDQVIGMEWAGEVVEVGNEVSTFHPGDRVMCTGAGAYAEFAVADAGRCMAMPEALSWDEAASLMLALQTMHDALVTQGGLEPGSTVLIQGASSCMGLVGMQIAKALGAAKVLGTSRNAEHRALFGNYGCDVAIDSSVPEWSRTVREATGKAGATIVVDQVSGDAVNQCLGATAIGGRLVNVGRLAGAKAAVDLNLHAFRRISYIGVTFRTRSRDEVRVLNEKMVRDLAARVSSIKVPVARHFKFADVKEAMEFLSGTSHMGKVLLVQ